MMSTSAAYADGDTGADGLIPESDRGRSIKKVRVIARLDVKSENVIKGVHLECLRVIGKPKALAQKYYDQGVDEFIYLDIVASLYQRNNLLDIVKEAATHTFVPMTVGGGIRSLEDMEKLLNAGADKVAINTAAITNHVLISEGAKRYGSQCIVVSIESKKNHSGGWEAYTDNGRNETGLDVVSWAKKAVDHGAGEVLLTSVDREGTAAGFDLELIQKVVDAVPVPVIASGGAGKLEHFSECVRKCGVDAVASAHMLHYNKCTISDIKSHLAEKGIGVRMNYE